MYRKRSVFIPMPKKGNTKECSNYHTIALISHTSRVMVKIVQARLQQYANCELLDVQGEFRKSRNQRSNCQHPLDYQKSKSFRKTSTFPLLTMPKPLTMWITTDSGKFLKRWEYQATWPAFWEICMQVKKQQLEQDMEQTGSKWGKEYIKAVYCHPAYLASVQSTSCKMPCWMKYKLESRLWEKYQ